MKKHDAEEFLREVALLISPEVNYLEALVYYAEQRDMEVEVLAEMVKKHQPMKALLREDAEKLNLMTEKLRRLPVGDD